MSLQSDDSGHLFVEVLLLVVILFLLSQKSYKPPKRPLTKKVCAAVLLSTLYFICSIPVKMKHLGFFFQLRILLMVMVIGTSVMIASLIFIRWILILQVC